jgi:diguanylate cyclase (GGDEF)-like protein
VRPLSAAAAPQAVPEPAFAERRDSDPGLVESYRRLADIFHDVLAEQSLDALLERIADTLAELIPYDTLSIYQADEAQTILVPVLARDKWAEQIMNNQTRFGEGISGWAALHRQPVHTDQAHLDPRVKVVPGTPADEPEALVSVPLIARDRVKGTLNVYRLGEEASFTEAEFELAIRFGDAAALALDNAQIRARLEHQAQTDGLTGLFNHRYFHERLRAELTRASRSRDSLALLMLDIDDFKRVNDVHGHGTGDEVLKRLGELLKNAVRGSDVVCRLGGEEFAVIMSPGGAADALNLAQRLAEELTSVDFEPAGKLTLSIGVSEGPEHAMNPRELVTCAEAAMMTAKARGKNQVVLFDEETDERPAAAPSRRDVRSIAHLKMLQSLSNKLNRLTAVRDIGDVITSELRLLIDYYNCRVSVIEEDAIIPIAFRGDLLSRSGEHLEFPVGKIGEGITGRCAETGESLLIRNTLECEFAVLIPGTELHEESMIAVPLTYGSRVIGTIVVSKLGVDQFDEDDLRLLEVLAGHAAVGLENARLYEAQRREAEHLKALLEFTVAISHAPTLEEIGKETVQAAAGLLGAGYSALWLRTPFGDYEIAADTDLGVAPIVKASLDADSARRLIGERTDPFVLSAEQAPQLLPAALGTERRGATLAPLRDEDGISGWLVVGEAEEDGGRSIDERLQLLGGLSYQASTALQRAESFENLERTFVSTIEALANALEAKDEYTSSHTRWITDMALRVGAELGFDGPTLKRLELGALFHDIGKIGIPATILLKPGPLTAEERAIIETHPELGEKILAPIERLADVRAIIRSCHEHFDGKGYPDGKEGDEIPVESRIILVCDAFHAMTTDRPYRKRLSIEEACRRLRDAAGTQFDPDVVEVFLGLPVLRHEDAAA